MDEGYDWVRDHSEIINKGIDWPPGSRIEDERRRLDNDLARNQEHIMLLSHDEAQQIIDDLLGSKPVSIATGYAGNIKDALVASNNLSKLFSYQQAGKTVFTLKGFGIKATQYAWQGKMYVKITGYPSLRRILTGTRYRINHPKLLEVGIGRAGFHASLVSGARFCIWFSACWRLVEVIFKSDHDVAAFLGNVTMDVAKVIVSTFVSILAGGGISFLTSAVAASLAVPIWGGIVGVVIFGTYLTYRLNELDSQYDLSNKLIACIRDGLRERQKISEWNDDHSLYERSFYPRSY